MSLYSLRNLRQTRQGRAILDLPRLDIEAGLIHALLGPNGAGKTTLLETLALLVPPSSGRIYFLGKEVEFGERELIRLRRQVLLVDQHPIMFTCSVRKNVEFGLKIRKIEKKARNRIVDESLAMVGMEGFAEAFAPSLSGGETQRLALARALALSPRVLLCDEPTASVDSDSQDQILALLRRINEEQGTTIILATHNLGQAARLAGGRIVLDLGRLVDGARENVFPCQVEERNGDWFCLIGKHLRLRLDRPQVAKGPARIRIHADRVETIPLTPDSPRSPEIVARVLGLAEQGERIAVHLDVGVELTLSMDRRVYLEQRPGIGENLGLRIPAQAIEFL